MPHRDEVHIRATVVGLTPGEPAFVTIRRDARHDGKPRSLVLKLQTPADLFARLFNEVEIGQEIEATIVTEWRKASYATCLADFLTLAATPSGSVRVA